MIMLLHCAVPQCELPVLWALASEMHMATRVILATPEFMHLNTMFQERRHPVASRVFYALASIEDRFLQHLEESLLNEFGEDCDVLVYMFDGAVVRMRKTGNEPHLRQVLDSVGERLGVTCSIERM